MNMEASSAIAVNNGVDLSVSPETNIRGPKTPKRLPKDATTPKSTGSRNVPGARFQCPRCPKNFSRIENLTRHQANHEDVGKFACVVCRKRFTRSDLLNRHRRIHGTPAESSKVPHVTPLDYPEASPGNDLRGFESVMHQDGRRSTSQETSSTYSNPPPLAGYQIPMQQGMPSYANPPHVKQESFQALLPGSGIAVLPHSPLPQQHQSHGLTSLMEAALAPADGYSFTPAENINPALWDGFMLSGDNTNTNSYMGSYDADMSWTLDYFQSEASPNYLLDEEMVNAFDDLGENPYQYQQTMQYQQPLQHQHQHQHQQQQSHQQQPPVTQIEDDDEEASDWPDKVARPDEPQRRPNRVVPVQLLPVSWQPVLDEARISGLSAATIRPMHIISDTLREQILSALNGNSRNELSRAEISDALFPPSNALDFFLRLYIRYIQPRFPVLHLPTFDIYNTSPLLLVAMMILGSSHSAMDRGRFSRLFHDHLRIAVVRIQEVDFKYLRTVDNILTYFLLCLAGTWSGSKHSYEFAEGGRGILVTACRRSHLLDCRQSSKISCEAFQRPGRSQLDASWLAWIETEKRKRLGLSIYIFDCQYPALFNNQPYISKAETTNCLFPCSETYWESPDSASWKRILPQGADSPHCTYYLHALNCCLLRKWIKPPPPFTKTNEFGKVVLIYALHTHIFEWRQAVSMLNPTGLIGTFGNSAHDVGDGLRDRRKWLIDGLDSFAECYKELGTGAVSCLLHHLGYVSLDVSLSDMHLVAGRSVNKNDSSFAQENLKYWANSDISNQTMSHVYEMLELAHHYINSGVGADSSHEIAVCLFTGGMICWTFAKLRNGANRELHVQQVRKASLALRQMGCWRMCAIFGRILNGLEMPEN